MILARRCLAGCARSGGVPGSAPGLRPTRTPGAGPPSARPTVSSATVSQLRRQPASPSARPFLLGALGPDHHPAPSPSLRLPVSRTVARNSQGTAATLADGGNPSGRRQPYVTAATLADGGNLRLGVFAAARPRAPLRRCQRVQPLLPSSPAGSSVP